MIVIMNVLATAADIEKVTKTVKEFGLTPNVSIGKERTVIGLIGDKSKLDRAYLQSLHGVHEVIQISAPYKLVNREFHPEDTIIKISKDLSIGHGLPVVVMAGPCSVESEKQMIEIAQEVKKSGAHMIRGGAYKPRTSPYAFQGMGEEGLKIMDKARKETGLPFVTEVMDTRDVELVAEYTDMIQIGARNMQNFALLKEVGKTRKPILLKRGLCATIQEWLMAGEYIAAEGNLNIIFCERGIRTMETYTRNTFDISAIPVIKKLSHLPVITDPSHAVGYWDYVPSMARASVAAGADGLIIEVHNDPAKALSDGGQSLKYDKFTRVMNELRMVEKLCRGMDIVYE